MNVHGLVVWRVCLNNPRPTSSGYINTTVTCTKYFMMDHSFRSNNQWLEWTTTYLVAFLIKSLLICYIVNFAVLYVIVEQNLVFNYWRRWWNQNKLMFNHIRYYQTFITPLLVYRPIYLPTNAKLNFLRVK